ncbi:MAG: hypothetical protein H6702_25515 [Myxococcales bacterium]|nr:hypothetical protein [Myxococcales bacterium]
MSAKDLAFDAAFERLLDVLDLMDGFGLLAVEQPTALVSAVVAQRFRQWGAEATWLEFDGYEAATEGSRMRIVEAPPDEPLLLVAREVVEGPSADGWRALFAWLNLDRNRLVERQQQALLVCGPAWFHRLAWEVAPDLWSIRVDRICLPLPNELEGLPRTLDHWSDWELETASKLPGRGEEALRQLEHDQRDVARRLQHLGALEWAAFAEVRALEYRQTRCPDRVVWTGYARLSQFPGRVGQRAAMRAAALEQRIATTMQRWLPEDWLAEWVGESTAHTLEVQALLQAALPRFKRRDLLYLALWIEGLIAPGRGGPPWAQDAILLEACPIHFPELLNRVGPPGEETRGDGWVLDRRGLTASVTLDGAEQVTRDVWRQRVRRRINLALRWLREDLQDAAKSKPL